MRTEETRNIRYAVPTEPSERGDQQVCAHFGHCEMFALIDVDPDTRTLTDVRMEEPPPHEPGVLPRWLHEQGACVILTGGMGRRAIDLFRQHEIDVVTGVTTGTPEQAVLAHLNGTLAVTDNTCDH